MRGNAITVVHVIRPASGSPGHDRTRVLKYELTSPVSSAPQDQDLFDGFAAVVRGVEKDKVAAALHKNLEAGFEWSATYDKVDTFYDREDFRIRSINSQWIFDLEKEKLFFTSLSAYWGRECRWNMITWADLENRSVANFYMHAIESPIKLRVENPHLGVSYWRPNFLPDQKIGPFISQLLLDFNYQWRHVLRIDYNFLTLQRMARALIRLATLDFGVVERNHERTIKSMSLPEKCHVWISDLPSWEPFETDIVHIGRLTVVLCESLTEGLLKAQEHASSQVTTRMRKLRLSSRVHEEDVDEPSYMILSVRHIALCRMTDSGALECTAPEPLLHGGSQKWSSDFPSFLRASTTEPPPEPSEAAINYLIWATESARVPLTTPVLSLPFEIQDHIVKYMYDGKVAARHLEFLIDAGTDYGRNDDSLGFRSEEAMRSRYPDSPVESEVWFDDRKSGLVYVDRC